MRVWSQTWENGVGWRAYQPRFSDGRTLWKNEGYFEVWSKERPPNHYPDLYDHRDVAEKKAREYHLKELQHDWRPVSE